MERRDYFEERRVRVEEVERESVDFKRLVERDRNCKGRKDGGR